jgi:hypothetical protein
MYIPNGGSSLIIVRSLISLNTLTAALISSLVNILSLLSKNNLDACAIQHLT